MIKMKIVKKKLLSFVEQFTDRWIFYKEDSIEFYKQFYPKFYITFKFMYKNMQLYKERSLDCSTLKFKEKT